MNRQDADHPDTDSTTWRETPFLMLKGFLMGSADIVPGVSGGTMALITGVYERLINAIKSVDGKAISSLLLFRLRQVFLRVHWRFFLILFSGIILAVIFFTRVVPLQVYMFTHPELVYGLFFGLIVGSVVLLVLEVPSRERSLSGLIPILLGTATGLLIVNLVPADTPNTFFYVFGSGALAICAMVLPGISGAYILLILRKYDYILTQLGNLTSVEAFDAFLNLIPFGLGALAGLALFTRFLSWVLRKYHTPTILVLVGFLIGSLAVIWPFQEREYEERVRSVEFYPYTDPLVQSLLERDDIPTARVYQRIGSIQNPNASFDELKTAEVETVSLRMVQASPRLPDREEGDRPAHGYAGMAGGLLLIGLIYYLRNR
ncbi:MAG: DUF368 domain-containing protein [Balneolaceae bacterium]